MGDSSTFLAIPFDRSTRRTKRVRFNPNAQQFFVFARSTSSSDEDDTLSSMSSSSGEILTPPHRASDASVQIWDGDSSHDAYAGYSSIPTSVKVPAMTLTMSASMQWTQRIPWNVHARRVAGLWDADCATTTPGLPQLVLRSDRLLGDILVAPAPGAAYITIGRVYEIIQSTLCGHISLDSSLFRSNPETVQHAIWKTSKHRDWNNGVNSVQYMDFLLDDHVVVGISIEPGAMYWVIKFGRLMTPTSSIVG